MVKTINIGTLIGEGNEDEDNWGKWPGRREITRQPYLPEMATGDLDQSLSVCGRWHFQLGVSGGCRSVVSNGSWGFRWASAGRLRG